METQVTEGEVNFQPHSVENDWKKCLPESLSQSFSLRDLKPGYTHVTLETDVEVWSKNKGVYNVNLLESSTFPPSSSEKKPPWVFIVHCRQNREKAEQVSAIFP